MRYRVIGIFGILLVIAKNKDKDKKRKKKNSLNFRFLIFRIVRNLCLHYLGTFLSPNVVYSDCLCETHDGPE